MMHLFDRFAAKAARPSVRPAAAKPSPERLALEAVNPLAGLGVTGAQSVFDAARRGNYSMLGRVYEEIEAADPTLLVVSERRAGAVSDLSWRMREVDGRSRGYDKALAGEQMAAAAEMLAGCENLAAAVEHLSGAFFRGHAHIQPEFEGGALRRFLLPETHLFCLDRARGVWQLNPTLSNADPGPGGLLLDIPPEDGLVTLVRRRHIDYPALAVYIRAALGERHWGRFVDRFGLPPATLIMPPLASEEDEAKFLRAAEAAADGRTVALPSQSDIRYAGEARGADPFSEYLRHQQELVVLMATGGLLTTLSEAGSGTLAGNAHADTWRQVVRKDARIMADALQAQLVAPWLRERFPGSPVCAEFDFDAEPAPTASEVLADAVQAHAAGLEIDPAQLSEKTGYRLSRLPQSPDAGGMFAQDLRNGIANPLQNARKGADGETPPPAPSDAPDAKSGEMALLRAMASDLAPVRGRLEALLALPEAERPAAARALMEELPSLLPADPEMAAVLEEEMARAFADAALEGPGDAPYPSPVGRANDPK